MTHVTWHVIAVLAAAVSSFPGNPRQPSHGSQASYTSESDSFRFSYPRDFEVCTAGKMQPCLLRSYIPPCKEDAVVCVVYPASKTQGTNFGAAAFQVRKIHAPDKTMTPEGCVGPYANDPQRAAYRSEYLKPASPPEELIGGVRFVHGVSSGVAAGHSGSVDAYRSFHQGSCYELSVNRSESAAANFDPPIQTLSPAEHKEMDAIFSRVLHSFRFTD